MTWTERIDRIGAFAKAAWWILLIIGLVFSLLLLSRACNSESEAKAALERFQMDSRLREAGFIVAIEANQKALDAKAAEIPALTEELERLRKAAPGVRIVRVKRIVTAPASAEGVPRPPPMPGEPCPQCVFAWGDSGELRINSVELETRKGNQVAVVAGETWRIKPGPETRIHAGVASAPISTMIAESLPLSSSPGWGGGLAGGYGTSGPLGSALLVSPPFFWKHVEVAGIVSAGPGLFSGQLAVIYRP
jgi:hypothetical protein